MNKDIENGSTNRNRSIKIYALRKWRSLPRIVKLYSFLVIFCFLTFFGIMISYSSLKTPVNLNDKLNPLSTLIPLQLSSKSPSPLNVKKNLDKPRVAQNKPIIRHDLFNADIYVNMDNLQSQLINEKQHKIIEATRHSWEGYRKFAWGADHLKPITRQSHNWFGVGLTIIDSLDTLLLMNMDDEFEEALNWIENQLNFNKDRDVNCFEMTIRVLGGLLSAYHLTMKKILLEKAKDIGDRLIHCFDSPSKVVPYSDINLESRRPHAPLWSIDSSLSEISTVQLEYRYLSQLTKNDIYEKRSFLTSQHLHNLTKLNTNSLLSMYINPINGRSTLSTITLGARGDSYYEYLLKQYLQTDVLWLLNDYIRSINDVEKHLLLKTPGELQLKFIAERVHSNRDISPKMDHLVCFLPGTLALGYLKSKNKLSKLKTFRNYESLFEHHLKLAEDLARTCYHMYNLTETGLSPEIAYFKLEDDLSNENELQIRPADTHNLLRPEYVESLFYLYHITGNKMYREQGWKIFNAFNRYCRVRSGGFTSIGDVRNPQSLRPRDMQESFWLAETLKYLYLLFSDDKKLIDKLLNNYVFNTEGHLIPIIA